MLMITSSVWMVNWVHSDSSNNWEVFSLSLMSPVLSTSLKNRLFISTSSSNDSDHGSRLAVNSLSDTRRKFDSGLETILRVGNDSHERSRSSSELSIISFSKLNIGNKGTLRDLTNRQNVTNLKSGFFSTENSLSGKHAFNSQVQFLDFLIVIRIFELDSGNRSTSAWIVEDLLDNTFNKSVSLLVVEVLISNFSESSEGMSLVDRVGSSLSLRSDGSSHSVYKFYIFLRLIFYLFMEVDLIDELSDLWVVQVETLNVVEK